MRAHGGQWARLAGLGGDEESRYDSTEEAKAAIFATFGDHGEWIDEDGLTHYHTSPEAGCGSAWSKEVPQ